MNSSRFFIEVDCFQQRGRGQSVSGDVYLQKRYNNRIIQVLSDGAGSGIKANVIASVIASMAVNYTYAGEPVLRAAKAIIETFARGDRKDDVNQATFTIIDINDDGQVKTIEFENPPVVILRNGKIFSPPRIQEMFDVESGYHLPLYITEFQAEVEDRIITFSDGVTLSGYATRRMPQGWQRKGVVNMLCKTVADEHRISASHLCKRVVEMAEMNDLFVIKNDMSCASVYFRQPRKILVVTGPPFNQEKDRLLAEIITQYEGSTVICGGTTAQIVARESGKEISVVLKKDASGLPPESKMDGVSMITEGVLTLGRVKVILSSIRNSSVKGNGIDMRLVRMLLEHDIVEFIVGTRINPIHQDPNLPVELELRRNVVKDIAWLLESKYMKEVNISYL